MKTSSTGLALLKTFEGLRTKAYRDGGGVWTIGYGHTAAAGLPIPREGMVITAQDAMDILARDLGQYERGVSAALKRTPTQNQFDAMVSLCYNIGIKAFQGSSIVRYFNEGNTRKAAERFLAWNQDNGKVIPGLTRRREAERTLFLEPNATVGIPPPPDVPAPDPKPEPQKPRGLLSALIDLLIAIFKRKA